MESKGFGGGLEYLPSIKEEEEELLDIWEGGTPAQRKEFEKYLEAEESELFKHFKKDILVKHPEYQP